MSNFFRNFLDVFSPSGFRGQLAIALVLGIISTAVISTFVVSNHSSNVISKYLANEGKKITETFANQSVLGLLIGNSENVQNLIATTLNFPHVEGVGIYFADRTPLVEEGKSTLTTINESWANEPALLSETNDAWYFIAPVFSNEEAADNPFIDDVKPELLGYVRIVKSKSALQDLLGNIRKINIMISLGLSVALMLLLLSITQTVTKPLKKLMGIMHLAQEGQTDLRAKPEGPRDIKEMVFAFNSMIESLEERERELATARDSALQSARVKGEFAANVSHELRTPLNGILGMLELLGGTGLSSKQKEYVGIARNSSDALTALIDDILDFSKIDSGKLHIELHDFNLRELLDEVVSIMASQAQTKDIDLAHLICQSLPPVLRGDPRRLRQLLLNLCGNSIKFTQRGEISIHVNILSQHSENITLRFEVKDTGIGITEEAKDKIFDAFSQADQATTKKFGGTGLGLAICKQLVKVMNGQIGVDSEVGVGSSFWFEIPMQVPEQSTDTQITPAIGQMDLNILIIDDSEVVQFNMMQNLERWGAHVECADNAVTALQKLECASRDNRAFDMVFVDELMPATNGIELIRTIGKSEKIERPKLILMTNQAHADSFLERFSEIDSYVRKPILQSTLFDCISTVTSGSVNIVNPVFVVEEEHKNRLINANVLVAEDNSANQQVALGMLERIGCTVTLAANGLEALSIISRTRFDAVFMDCNMPEMDGYEATRKIREIHGPVSKVPVIAMTANVQDGDREKCLEAGMDDYLSKPLKLERIRIKLEEWLPDLVQVVAMDTAIEQALAPAEVETTLIQTIGPIDVEHLDELESSVGSAFTRMVEVYVEDLPGQISSLEQAINDRDAEQIKQCAHSIKGSSKNFGANELAAVAKELEDMGREGEIDEAHTRMLMLFDEVDRVIEYLNKRINPNVEQDISDSQVEVKEVEKILIADDDRSMRLALINVLDSDGYELHEVSNGLEALEYCQEEMPDLVLLDAMMPEMDGFEACTKIRALESAAHMPILIVTALDDDESVEKAFSVGATDYLPKPVHFAVLRQRISRLLRAVRTEKYVRQLAYHDSLTGLPNRTTFSSHLSELLSKVRAEDEMIAILFLDLDRFKLVNDTLGHSVGDMLLKAVADRLQNCVRVGDMVARLGGDEFTVVLDRVKSREGVANIAHKICDSLDRPFTFGEQEMFVSTSIGISMFPSDGDDIGTLMKHADTAMFRAKEVGRSFFFYENHMEAAVTRKVEIEADLRRSINRDQIDVYYQPKANLATREIVGMEALVRWNHPTKGMIGPDEFIPLAEETGLINEVGLWVMISACLQAQDWVSKGYTPYCVAVNLSGVQLERGNIVGQVEQVLEETGLPAHLLELEITESTIMHHPEKVIDVLKKLKEMGVRLAVDDFGTGYSSLNYLKRFPIDLLKIDAEFVRDVMTDPDDRAIIRSIIALAKSMRLEVVAEGVESREQEDFLRAEGCDFIQGFYVGRPMEGEEFERRVLMQIKGTKTELSDLSKYRSS